MACGIEGRASEASRPITTILTVRVRRAAATPSNLGAQGLSRSQRPRIAANTCPTAGHRNCRQPPPQPGCSKHGHQLGDHGLLQPSSVNPAAVPDTFQPIRPSTVQHQGEGRPGPVEGQPWRAAAAPHIEGHGQHQPAPRNRISSTPAQFQAAAPATTKPSPPAGRGCSSGALNRCVCQGRARQ